MPDTTKTAGAFAGIGRILAISSAKGGVGKSTVCVNLAHALHGMGKRVGILDADILGPSVPGMLGVDTSRKPAQSADGKVEPAIAHGIKCVSMGMFSSDDQPMMLRGPMVGKYLNLFLGGVDWGELDVLLLDMPPGTGDIQLNIAQAFPLSGAIIVTTPQAVSAKIVRRGIRMFMAVQTPILGLIENMRTFTCPSCGATVDLFGHGGGERLASELDVPFLGSLALDAAVMDAGDAGVPIGVLSDNSQSVAAYRRIADQIEVALTTLDSGMPPFRWDLANDRGAPPWDRDSCRADGAVDAPTGLRRRDARTLAILWQDGSEQAIDFRDLRLACGCALCRDEMTGRPKIDPSTIPLDVRPLEIRSVGTYAIAITWSDGHSSGIHPFAALQRMAGESHVQDV